MKIWAHRGCSQRYPENTILSFEKAASLKGLTGIELDVQLTRDGEMVVIHDERVDRTTEGIGFVRDFTLADISKLHIYADDNNSQHIPTLGETLDLLSDKMKAGLKLNIELKNGKYYYTGMEEKVIELVQSKGLQNQVVYSSFYAKSLAIVRNLDGDAEIGILDTKASDCMWKIKGGCGATALHPFWKCIDLTKQELLGYTVRAWLSGHLYPEKPTGTRLDFTQYEKIGITDMILNEPESYLTSF